VALALDLLEERALVGLVDVPEAEIVLVDAQLSGPTDQLPPQPHEDARPLAQEQVDSQAKVAMGITTYVLARDERPSSPKSVAALDRYDQ
jgi:hypothetical protein